MTIDTQGAAPRGAAPASITAAAIDSRSGDARAAGDAFAMLVEQMTGIRPSNARAARFDRAAAPATPPPSKGASPADARLPSTGILAPVAEGPRADIDLATGRTRQASVSRASGDVPADDATAAAALTGDLAAGVTVPVWLFPIAEPQGQMQTFPLGMNGVAGPGTDPGRVDGVDPSVDGVDPSIDPNAARGSQRVTSRPASAPNQQPATALSFGAAPQAGAPVTEEPGVTAALDAPAMAIAPTRILRSANDTSVAHVRSQAPAPDVIASGIAAMTTRGALAPPLDRTTPGAASQAALRGAAINNVASPSAPTVAADLLAPQRVGCDRPAALGPGGNAPRADHAAVDAGHWVSPADPAAAGSNDPSGPNAGREFSDRAASVAPVLERRDGGSPVAASDLASRADVSVPIRTSDLPAVPAAHSDRAALSAASAADLVPSLADPSVSRIPDEADVRRQIVRAIKFQWRDGAGDVRLTLQPEYLGDVAIALRVEQNGGVTAHVHAESADVRAWIGANEPLLRQALTDQGLTLDRLVVARDQEDPAGHHESRHRRPQQEEPQGQQPKRREAATFEVIV